MTSILTEKNAAKALKAIDQDIQRLGGEIRALQEKRKAVLLLAGLDPEAYPAPEAAFGSEPGPKPRTASGQRPYKEMAEAIEKLLQDRGPLSTGEILAALAEIDTPVAGNRPDAKVWFAVAKRPEIFQKDETGKKWSLVKSG